MRRIRCRLLAAIGAPTGLTVTVYRQMDSEWRWRIQAPNGRILAISSESYARHNHAVTQASSLFPQATLIDEATSSHPSGQGKDT